MPRDFIMPRIMGLSGAQYPAFGLCRGLKLVMILLQGLHVKPAPLHGPYALGSRLCAGDCREMGQPEVNRRPPYRVGIGDALGAEGGVYYHVHLAALDHVDYVGPALGDLEDGLDLYAPGREEPGGAAGGENLEAAFQQVFGNTRN